MKRRKISIMYNEIATYYFTPASDNRIKTLIVEKMNQDKFVFEVSYVGEDFVEIFQKDYISTFTQEIIEKIKHGYEVGFGIMSGRQKTVFKVFNTKKMAKNLTFADQFFICNDGLKYEDELYKWSKIRAGYDIQTGSIEIVDENGQMIINTYFTYVEKGEFPFNIIDILIDETKENQAEIQESQAENPIDESSEQLYSVDTPKKDSEFAKVQDNEDVLQTQEEENHEEDVSEKE